MFNKLRNLFASDPHKIVGAEITDTSAKWLLPEDNQYGLTVLDCSTFCQSVTSVTTDERIAVRFSQLRFVSGEEHFGKLPNNAALFECELAFPFEGEPEDGIMYRACAMEEMWDIYLNANKLYFAQSWTGELAFVGNVIFENDEMHLRSVAADPKFAGGHDYAVAVVDFLIKSHIYQVIFAHPLPADLPNDPDRIANFSYYTYGRFAAYGSFEDTTVNRLQIV